LPRDHKKTKKLFIFEFCCIFSFKFRYDNTGYALTIKFLIKAGHKLE
jgi:hypothetical protein